MYDFVVVDVRVFGSVFSVFLCVCVNPDSTCHTTRGPYYGEEDGSDYYFVSEEEFLHMIHTVGRGGSSVPLCCVAG